MKHPFLVFVIGTATLLSGAGLHAASNYATPYTFTTLAGKAGVRGSDDGQGTNATFNGPEGLAVDGNGNVYIADTYSDTIRMVDTNGIVTTIAGQADVTGSVDGQGTNATFNGPVGIALDGNGNLFVVDSGNNTIRKIDTNENVTTIAGQTGVGGSSDGIGTNATFSSPFGIAVDGSGNIFVADVFNSEIRKIDSNGMVTTLAGQSGVYGSKNGNGTNATFAHYSPQAVTVDGNGSVYVADTYNDTIRKIDSNGLVTTLAGKSGVKGGSDGIGTNATFDEPAGVVVDGNGNVYVADNSTIRKIDSNGVVTTLAGKYPGYKTLNGTGSGAGFDFPSGIALDDSGNIYVSEYVGNTIRKGSLGTNIVQTIKFEPIPKKVYGAPSFNLTATATSGLPVSFSSANTNVATVFSNTVTVVGAGTTTITATQTGSQNFKGATPVKQVLTVAQATQTISFGAIPSHTYGDAAFSLTAKASSSTNQTVTFTSSKTNVATVSGNMVTIVGTGLSTITASVSASANFKAAPSVKQVLNVAGLPQTILFQFVTVPSGGNTSQTVSVPTGFGKGIKFNAVALSTSGLPVTFTSDNPRVVSITSSGVGHCNSPGTANITAHQAGNYKYSKATSVTTSIDVFSN